MGSLYHYQARWYSPVLGRFLSPDPIVPQPGNPQAFNRYSYVYNNPLKYIDNSGHAAAVALLPVIQATASAVVLIMTAVVADYAAEELAKRMAHPGDSQPKRLTDSGGTANPDPDGNDPRKRPRIPPEFVGDIIQAYQEFQRPLEQENTGVHDLVEKRF